MDPKPTRKNEKVRWKIKTNAQFTEDTNGVFALSTLAVKTGEEVVEQAEALEAEWELDEADVDLTLTNPSKDAEIPSVAVAMVDVFNLEEAETAVAVAITHVENSSTT